MEKEKKLWQQRRRRYVNLVVGMFVIAAIIFLAVWVGYFVWKISVGEKTFTVRVVFERSYGLSNDNTVTVDGIYAGTVQDVYFNAENKVEATLNIFIRFRPQIRTDSVAQVTWPSLVGVAVVNIFPGSADAAVVPENGYIQTVPSRQIQGQDVAEMILEMNDWLKILKDEEGPFVKGVYSMAAISGRLERGEGSAGMFLQDDGSLYRDLATSTKNLASISEKLNQIVTEISEGKGTIGKFLKDEGKIYDDLKETSASIVRITARLDTLLADISEGRGTVGMLIKDEEFKQEILASVKDMRNLLSGTQKLVEVSSRVLDMLPDLVERSIQELEDAQRILQGVEESFLLRDIIPLRKEPEINPIQK